MKHALESAFQDVVKGAPSEMKKLKPMKNSWKRNLIEFLRAERFEYFLEILCLCVCFLRGLIFKICLQIFNPVDSPWLELFVFHLVNYFKI